MADKEMKMNSGKIKELAISDIKALAANRGLIISDEAAKNVLDDMVLSVEITMINGSSSVTPRGLLRNISEDTAQHAQNTGASSRRRTSSRRQNSPISSFTGHYR
jgi:hypothetical protein